MYNSKAIFSIRTGTESSSDQIESRVMNNVFHRMEFDIVLECKLLRNLLFFFQFHFTMLVHRMRNANIHICGILHENNYEISFWS